MVGVNLVLRWLLLCIIGLYYKYDVVLCIVDIYLVFGWLLLCITGIAMGSCSVWLLGLVQFVTMMLVYLYTSKKRYLLFLYMVEFINVIF